MYYSLAGNRLSRWFFNKTLAKFLTCRDCLPHDFYWGLLVFHRGVLNSIGNVLRFLMWSRYSAHGRSRHWHHLKAAALAQRHVTAALNVDSFACTNQIFLVDVQHVILEYAVLLRLVNIGSPKFISWTGGSTLLIGRVLWPCTSDPRFGGVTPLLLFHLFKVQQVLASWSTCRWRVHKLFRSSRIRAKVSALIVSGFVQLYLVLGKHASYILWITMRRN